MNGASPTALNVFQIPMIDSATFMNVLVNIIWPITYKYYFFKDKYTNLRGIINNIALMNEE